MQGRLVDTFGQRRVLVPLGFLHAAALGALVLAGQSGAPTAALVGCGLLAGFAIPPTSSASGAWMWPHLLRDKPQLLQPAYALDSVLIELIFILGPLLTGLLTVARVSPQAALIVSAASVDRGHAVVHRAAAVARVAAGRARRRARDCWARSARRACAALVLDLAAGRDRDRHLPRSRCPRSPTRRARASWPACCSPSGRLGSAAGGLVYGALSPAAAARPRAPGGRRRCSPLGLLPLAAAPSIAVMALLVIPAGMFIAPLLATRNELVGRVAPAGRAHRGLHVARDRVRGRHLDRLGDRRA